MSQAATTLLQPQQTTWDAFVRTHPRGHLLQLWNWGELKGAYGWSVLRIALGSDESLTATAQILLRTLPFHLGKLAYLPFGPLIAPDRAQDIAVEQAVWQAIHKAARQHGARFLKWEPGIFFDGEPTPDFATLGFRPGLQTIQPPNTIIIDITDDDETILARMNQGTRRKIRQSMKKDVIYYQGDRTAVEKFNAIMHVTGERKDFGVHEPAYYASSYDLFVPQGDAALFMAEHEDDTLAGIMVFAVGDSAWYISGASSNVKRNLMASYGVQWQAIQWARARGCKYYDMWGIPDADEPTLEAQFQERSDGLWGVYGFKRGWGGQIVRSQGTWDTIYNPVIYQAYKAALTLRQRSQD